MLCECGNAEVGPRSKTGKCARCAVRAGAIRRYTDPAQRKATSEAKKRGFIERPETLAALIERSRDNLRVWHRNVDRDWSAWRREQMMGWCPEERREEYRKLVRKVGSKEARRMIEEDIPGTRAHAARENANALLAMRMKRERERAEAY